MEKSVNNAILKNEYVALFLGTESLIWFIFFILALIGIWLFLKWDFKSYSQKQYKRERVAWLITTSILALAPIKFLLLPYFVFTIDYLSGVVPGAMCGAGVISFNNYGMELLYLKVFNLFLLGLWIVLNKQDLKSGKYPFFRPKMALLIFVALSFTLELFWDFKFFGAIDIHKVINCCSTLYGLLEGVNPLPYGLDQNTLLLLFFLLFGLIISAWIGEVDILLFLGLLLFLQIAYYAQLYFFGPYIYAQPNHNCPFCMLQREYNYIGYLIWGTLLGGIFLGFLGLISKYFFQGESKKLLFWMGVFLFAFVLLNLFYVGFYYFENGTFLQEIDTNSMPGMEM